MGMVADDDNDDRPSSHGARQSMMSGERLHPVQRPCQPGFIRVHTKHSSAISLLLIFSAWMGRMCWRSHARTHAACGR